jgi:hypothetical protein
MHDITCAKSKAGEQQHDGPVAQTHCCVGTTGSHDPFHLFGLEISG